MCDFLVDESLQYNVMIDKIWKMTKAYLHSKQRSLNHPSYVHLYLQRLKSFSLEISVDPKYHPKIIGRKGAIITRIRTNHDVIIQFPSQNAPSQDVITITGFEENAEAAKEEILAIVQELVSTIIVML